MGLYLKRVTYWSHNRVVVQWRLTPAMYIPMVGRAPAARIVKKLSVVQMPVSLLPKGGIHPSESNTTSYILAGVFTPLAAAVAVVRTYACS